MMNNNCRVIDHPIVISEGGLTARNILDAHEIIQAYQLRHRIFCETLGWRPEAGNGLEIDNYDIEAIFFGVFDEKNKLLAFLRIITPEKPFMLENEFIDLVGPDHKIRKESDTVEISRFCVAPEIKTCLSFNVKPYHIYILLYKSVYHWCIKNNIRYTYLVIGRPLFRLLQMQGFPCKALGKPKRMPDGFVTVAAIMEKMGFEEFFASKQPKMLKWFTRYQSIPVQRQLRQPVPD